MAVDSSGSLVDALRQYRLLEPSQLDEVTRTLQARFSDPKAVAGELIRRGWLTPFQVNQLFQGRGQELLLSSYVLIERIGEGGMGQVFKARNWKLGRIVALKLIRKERLDNPSAIRRFQREVRAAAALSHPNIVLAYDADEIAGTHLLVMEYVEGATDLAKLVKRDGPLPVAQACEFIRQAALGLQHANERGLVHRDIKPHNLLLTTGGTQIKVLDMGLARLDSCPADAEGSSAMTREGAVMGTPDYIAPEQAREAHTVDIRADVYSLGCSLYQLLTGRVPFPGGSFTEKLLKHQMDEPAPVESLRKELPPGLAAVIRKMMAKRCEDRYQTPGEVATVLAAGLAGAWPEEQPSSHGWSGVGNLSHTMMTAVRRPGVRLPWMPLAVVGVVLFVAAAAAVVLSRRDPGLDKSDALTGLRDQIVEVAANRTWQDTGIDVQEGSVIYLTPRAGLWRKGQTASSARGLEKAPRDRALLPEANFLCLLARIGDDPEPTAVMMLRQELRPKRTARLFLQINDLDVDENSGSIKIEIEGGRPGDPIPPPGPTPYQIADVALRPLLARTEQKDADPVALRDGLLHLRSRLVGTPQLPRANLLLADLQARLPSALDALKPADVSPEEAILAGAGNPPVPPPGLVSVLGSGRFKAWNSINHGMFTADGKLVVSVHSGMNLTVWDAVTGRRIRALRVSEAYGWHGVASAFLALEGKAVVLRVAGSEHTLHILDFSTGESIRTLTLGPQATYHYPMALHPDGRTVLVGHSNGSVTFRDLVTGEVRQTLKAHASAVFTVSIARDGKRLATGSGTQDQQAPRELKLWQIDGAGPPREVGVLLRDRTLPWPPVFSPDGSLLVGQGLQPQEVITWDLSGPEPKQRIVDARSPVYNAFFAPDGKTLAMNHIHVPSVSVWDRAGPAITYRSLLRDVTGFAISPDGRALAARSRDKVLTVWDLATEKVRFPADALPPHYTRATFAPDGTELALIDGNAVVVMDPVTRRERLKLEGHDRAVLAVAFSPDGTRIATGSSSGPVKLWDRATGKELKTLPGHSANVWCVSFSPDGAYLTAGGSSESGANRVIVWDLKTFREVSNCRNLPAWHVVHGPGSQACTIVLDDRLLVWDLTRDQERQRIKTTGVASIAVSPDGKTVAAGGVHGGFSVRLWNGTSDKFLFDSGGHSWDGTSVVFAPSGRQWASIGHEGFIYLWESPSGRKLKDWHFQGALHGGSFSADGRYLAIPGANGAVYVLRLFPAE